MAAIKQTVQFARSLYGQRALTAYHGFVRHDPVSQLQLRYGRTNPYPIYERLRAAGPMWPTRLGNWATPSYALCSAVLRDRRMGAAPAEPPPQEPGFDISFLEMNPPDHTRLRRLVTPAFSPKQMATYRPRIEQTARRLLDDAGDRFDLVSSYATPVPMTVISDLLGVPTDRRDDFARFGAVIGGALDGIRGLSHARDLASANDALQRLFADLFELRRREPADDVISVIVAGETETLVKPTEMVPMCVLLLIAGFETTTNLISNAVLALLAHREQWEALCADPSLATAAVEETLRWDPPVQHTARYALEDLELGGVPVHKDQVVLTLIGGANRDPEVYDDPARFDITRVRPAEHLAFSSGIHYCLGQPLARLEATIALQALAERRPQLHRNGRVARRNASTIRGPLHLPVRGT